MDLPESLKAALGPAGGGADAATAAVDTAVSSAVASASKLTAVAMESLNQRYEIGVAHATAAWWEVQALEDKVFEAPTAALASAIKDAPYATAVAGTTCALLAVPGTRRILWHMSFGRMQSEEALVRAATRSAETLKTASEGSAVELVRLREAAVAAEEEMSRGRSKLRQAAADLKRLVRDHPQIFSNLLPIRRPSRKQRLTSQASNLTNLVTTTHTHRRARRRGMNARCPPRSRNSGRYRANARWNFERRLPKPKLKCRERRRASTRRSEGCSRLAWTSDSFL